MRRRWILIILLAAACGDAGTDNGGSGGVGGQPTPGTGTNAERLEGTPSQNLDCASLSGATAVYFDLESGFLVNLPFVPLLQATGGTAVGGDNSDWSFPPGYSGQTIQRGVTIQRNDGAVIFEHTTGTQITTDAVTAFTSVLQSVLTSLQLQPADAALICGVDIAFLVGPLPGRLISSIYDAGDRRMIVKVEVIDATTLQSLNTKVAIAPREEFDDVAGNVFLPMVWAQFPGGQGPLPRCNDGEDNDGDLLVDFPLDPECTSAEDNDESVL